MGCHTYFSRPITEEEFQKMKEYAPTEIYELTGDPNKSIYDKRLYDALMSSYTENIPCIGNYQWWHLCYGIGNPDLDGIDIREINWSLFVDVEEYYDLFRVKGYPEKVIRNQKELRKYLRKRYFQLTDEQLEKISEFFKRYPGGVITFG